MTPSEAPEHLRREGDRFTGFQHLMKERVQNILLVSSLYDSFILEQDGQINEKFLTEFLDLNLRHTPELTQVSSSDEALARLREGSFNLVITSPQLGEVTAAEFSFAVREQGLEVPIVLLGYDARALKDFMGRHDCSEIDRAFLWQGDVRILLAIVKYLEDRLNLEHDTREAGVQVIILIEDSVRYYSSYLPMIYAELLSQSQRAIAEGVNLSHKILRMRARPKILLCSTFEEAWEAFQRFSDDVLGVISDIEFPREGTVSKTAGLDFTAMVKTAYPDIPVLLQSSRPEYERKARALEAAFVLKGSPTLLNDLRRFMIDSFAFGDFVFRMPDGREVDRANSLKSLVRALRTVPVESLRFHSERNHFSNWLKARTEFVLADRLRPRKITDFASMKHIREFLIEIIDDFRLQRQQAIVSDFNPESFDPASGFARIGGGSLGGKARGLAFVRYLLSNYPVDRLFEGVRVSVPPGVVLGTDVFDEFFEANDLWDFAIHSTDPAELEKRILEADFPEAVRASLARFLELMDAPLAVRSSSLLEDSQYQPFTGVYETYMLPNDDEDLEERLLQLVLAIRMVYLSTFSRHARAYIRATPYRLEEEKMAVIIMKVVGAAHEDRYYPDFAGVARSYNFYPAPPLSAQDGVAAVALGMGKAVVEGGKCLQFSPCFPRHMVQFSSVQDVLSNSQRSFWALPLGDRGGAGPSIREVEYGLEAAENDGTLFSVGSTYSPENDAVYDGISRPGVRLVSFAPVLKYETFPLARLLEILLEVGSWGMGAPVEIEFAVNLSPDVGKAKEFGFLQMRPLALSREAEELDLGGAKREDLICRSGQILGNGRIEVQDLIVIDHHNYQRSQSQDVAMDVARMNGKLVAASTPYLLIGVGRWGSRDPWLGIPVAWDEISGARAIIEASFRDFRVTPSQGTHFFQNLTSFNVGYFTVDEEQEREFVDWDWLAQVEAKETIGVVRHLRFEEPIVVKMNGKRGEGLVTRPGVS